MMQYQVTGLMPFTNYSFRIEVENEIGKASSQWKNLTTLEDGILINFIMMFPSGGVSGCIFGRGNLMAGTYVTQYPKFLTIKEKGYKFTERGP